MSQITFRVDYAQAMRRGVNCPVPPRVTIEVDADTLSQEDRDALASRLDDAGRVRSRSEHGTFYSSPDTLTAPAPTLEAVLEVIRQEDDWATGHKARQAAEEERVVTEYLSKSDDSLLYRHSRYVTGYGWLDLWSVHHIGLYGVSDARVKARQATADAVADERNREIFAAIDAERAREKAERDQWIARHGSRKLQRMAAEGIDHAATYERERAKWDRAELVARLEATRPGWSLIDAKQVEEAKDVPDSALAILDAARVVAPACRLGRIDGRYVAVETWEGHTIYWPRD